jgi:GSCFA family
MTTDPSRQQLLDQFITDPSAFPPQAVQVNDLYLGATFNAYPKKPQLRADATDQIVGGWRPEQPVIGPDTRVIALGSCFASNFVLWLADHGFNRRQPVSPYNTLLMYPSAFESAPVLAQQLRWAFGDFNPAHALWIGPDKQLVQATEERRVAVRETLQGNDVLILTLGMSEIWYDRITGEPLWRAIPKRLFNADRHAFRVLTVAETVACLQEIEAIRATHLPHLKIIFTVSPIRLRATFRPVSAVTANSVSKAVIRAALDEFLRAQPDALGRTLFYFPSYEIVTDIFRDPFTEDNRHVQPSAIDQVLDLFARTYTSLVPASEPRAFTNEHLANDQVMRQLEELAAKNTELQRICDERQLVIDELDLAARERLALICELQQIAEERLAVINELDAVIRRRPAGSTDR